MASSIEETTEHIDCLPSTTTAADNLTQSTDDENEGETSLTRRARFKEQPVEKSGWIEVCQSESQIVTLTGVVARGESQGQQVEVQIELTEDEYSKLSSSLAEPDSGCLFGKTVGPHVFLLSVIFMPFSFISSFFMSFYLGTLAWYNTVVYYSEERTIFHKLVICPLLILTFPFTIGISAFFVGLYGCIIQLSWCFYHWCRQIKDLEKGFYGWVCNWLGISQCTPYNIVILDECGEIQIQR